MNLLKYVDYINLVDMEIKTAIGLMTDLVTSIPKQNFIVEIKLKLHFGAALWTSEQIQRKLYGDTQMGNLF